MEKQDLQEAAVALIALARISQQFGSAGPAASSSNALLLLEQMLLLCGAQRGALLLPSGPLLAHGEASLPAPALLQRVRILVTLGMSQEDLLPRLGALGSADVYVRTPPDAPGWLLSRIPLTAASARRADDPAGPSAAEAPSPVLFPQEALLVLGWDGTEYDPSWDGLEKGRELLPLLTDVVGVLLTNLLLVERLQEQETVVKDQAPREQEVLPTALLANVSHELRSPLTSIQGYAETLLRLDRRTSRQQRHEFLLAIKEASEEQAVLIDRLLEMAQLDAGTVRIERATVNLARVVREAFASAEQRCGAGEQGKSTPQGQRLFTLTLHLQDLQGESTSAEPLIRADRSRVREVLEHLLSNAIQYSPGGGPIDVTIRPMTVQSLAERVQNSSLAANHGQTSHLPSPRAWESQQGVDLCVRDQGMGIAAEHLERIFERFHRLDTTLTRPVNGLGLGLSICKRIVELHHGMIWAESVVGQGSVFHVWLPTAVGMEAGPQF
jgi:signal transduction histidine kinase